MPDLHIRNVPDDLCGRLRELAQNEGRSVNGIVVRLLDRAVELEQRRTKVLDLLAEIREAREKTPKSRVSSLGLLHQGRREREQTLLDPAQKKRKRK